MAEPLRLAPEWYNLDAAAFNMTLLDLEHLLKNPSLNFCSEKINSSDMNPTNIELGPSQLPLTVTLNACYSL
jgi:hypothetical protein